MERRRATASFWEPLDAGQGGKRVVLLDRIVGGSDDEDLDEHERLAPLHFCRHCGAAHPERRRPVLCTAA